MNSGHVAFAARQRICGQMQSIPRDAVQPVEYEQPPPGVEFQQPNQDRPLAASHKSGSLLSVKQKFMGLRANCLSCDHEQKGPASGSLFHFGWIILLIMVLAAAIASQPSRCCDAVQHVSASQVGLESRRARDRAGFPPSSRMHPMIFVFHAGA